MRYFTSTNVFFFLKYRRSQNFVFRPITIHRIALLSHYLLSATPLILLIRNQKNVNTIFIRKCSIAPYILFFDIIDL